MAKNKILLLLRTCLLFLVCGFLTFLIVLDYGGCSLLPASMEDCRTVDTTALKVVVGIFTVCLFCVEVIQIAVSFKRYFSSPENLMQHAILLITTILILDKNLDCEDKRHLAALVIVLYWV